MDSDAQTSLGVLSGARSAMFQAPLPIGVEGPAGGGPVNAPPMGRGEGGWGA